jgi:hypothetical protein
VAAQIGNWHLAIGMPLLAIGNAIIGNRQCHHGNRDGK